MKRLCALECRARKASTQANTVLHDKEAMGFVRQHAEHGTLYGTVRTSGRAGGSASYVSAALTPIDSITDRLLTAAFREPLLAYQALVKRMS